MREKKREKEIYENMKPCYEIINQKKKAMLGFFLAFLSNCICFTLKNNIFFGNS